MTQPSLDNEMLQFYIKVIKIAQYYIFLTHITVTLVASNFTSKFYIYIPVPR